MLMQRPKTIFFFAPNIFEIYFCENSTGPNAKLKQEKLTFQFNCTVQGNNITTARQRAVQLLVLLWRGIAKIWRPCVLSSKYTHFTPFVQLT